MTWAWFIRMVGGVTSEEVERYVKDARNEGLRNGHAHGYGQGKAEALQAMAKVSDPEIAGQVQRVVAESHEVQIELARREGREQGIQETKAKFSVVVEPFIIRESSFFSKRVTAGYQIEYFFEGFKIGEPYKIVRYDSTTMDMANLGTALAGIARIVGEISSKGMSPTIAGHVLFTIAKRFVNALNNQEVSSRLQREFENNGINLSQDAQVRTIVLNQSWKIQYENAVYNIRIGQNCLNVSLGEK